MGIKNNGTFYFSPLPGALVSNDFDAHVNPKKRVCYSSSVKLHDKKTNHPLHNMTSTFLDGLNTAQKEAVLHKEGPLLIVAGAGAGKTKTITHRIAQLIEGGVPARAILAVTFTNKAAGEMRERVGRLLSGHRGAPPLITTFHSLGVRLLREFHETAGIPRGFSIWDQDDSTRAVKTILKQLDTEEWTPRQILSALSREKGAGTSVREYRERAGPRREQTVALV